MTKALAETGTPTVSVAIVRDGKVVFAKAYGGTRLDPKTPAAETMRFAIGSVSKQFLAAALLLAQEDGKLSLDDKVAEYEPGLTRAGDVTIRQLLSHTSGYQDYYPQDYLPQFMREPVTAQGIVDRRAKKPLDFEPGATWQYSNTGFVVAGRVLEKATGTSPHAAAGSEICTFGYQCSAHTSGGPGCRKYPHKMFRCCGSDFRQTTSALRL